MTTPTDQQPEHDDQQQPDDTTTDETVEQSDETGEQQPGNRAGREAAKRRAQLRAAEAERDGLRERLQRYQRTEIEAVAADVLAHGDDLLAVRGDLATYLAEDGTVDPEKVRVAAREVAEQRPHWAVQVEDETGRRGPRGRGGPFSGAGQPKPVGSVDDSGKRVSWGDVVTPVGKKSA